MTRRKNREIRNAILESLGNGPKTVNEISGEIDSTWSTAMNHLDWLEFKGKVEKFLNKPRLKIYRLRNSELTRLYNNNKKLT